MNILNTVKESYISTEKAVELDIVGYVVGESKPYRAEIIAGRPLAVGEYLYMEYYGYGVLSMVSTSTIGSPVITSDIYDPRDIERIVKSVRGSERMYYFKGVVNILGYLDPDSGKLKIPPVPPPPGTEVVKAPKPLLSKIFSPDKDNFVRVGTLLREPSVEVRIDINKVVSRHLGIFAMTGMGKSNLVALLSKRTAEKHGTVAIFDYHGEYVSMSIPNLNVIKPKLNPWMLSLDELSRLLNIPRNASRQRAALFECLDGMSSDGDFFQNLKRCLQTKLHRYGSSAQKVLDMITAYEKYLRRILDESVSDVIDRLVLGAINVIDLSELQIHQADAVTAHWLKRILNSRKDFAITGKRGLQVPIILVIEEAHVLIPNDQETASKREAITVAREGRKFGVGLVIVSQRPRGLDSTILSQLGSLAILRIVHPEDQNHIARYCEPVFQDIVDELASLNVGEAVLLGEWVKIPTVAKIDYVEEKISGFDVDAVTMWRSSFDGNS